MPFFDKPIGCVQGSGFFRCLLNYIFIGAGTLNLVGMMPAEQSPIGLLDTFAIAALAYP